MKYDKNIAAHIISNIALIESALVVIGDVEDTIFKKFNAKVKKHVEDSNLVLGEDNNYEFYLDNDGLYFSVVDWEVSAKEQVAWYCFDHGEDNEELYYLTHLLGEHSKSATLRLLFQMEKDLLGLKLAKFKNKLRNTFLKSEALLALGFQLSGCGEFIELLVHLDKNKVAEEYPDLDLSFEPIVASLNTLFEAHPHFIRLVDAMKSNEDEDNVKK